MSKDDQLALLDTGLVARHAAVPSAANDPRLSINAFPPPPGAVVHRGVSIPRVPRVGSCRLSVKAFWNAQAGGDPFFTWAVSLVQLWVFGDGARASEKDLGKTNNGWDRGPVLSGSRRLQCPFSTWLC